MKHYTIAAILVLGLNVNTTASTPPLEREISLILDNEKVAIALEMIQKQASLVFSYRPSLISGLNPVSVRFKHKTVREALSMMLPETITFRSKNNYVILKERSPDAKKQAPKIYGYVVDKDTERKIADVTIYNPQTLESATTDEFGYYTIRKPDNNVRLSVNKKDYEDTLIAVDKEKEFPIVNISINPVRDSLKKDRTFKSEFNALSDDVNELFRKFSGYINTVNVTDTITREFQLSLLPFIGTNHKLSGNVYNRYSLNVWGGYARGVRAFEAGGFFNIDRENVKGVQMAGFFNVVGDSVKGTQLAGFTNITGRYVKGFQGAGLMNINAGNLKGVQMAGLVNMNARELKGAQLAGLLNVNTKKLDGVTVAGLVNIAAKCEGAMLAGLMNASFDTLRGFSGAGLLNVSYRSNNAAQIAGLMNVSQSGSTILQLAGLVNYSRGVSGFQAGFLNISDSTSGVPFGFLSIVKKGLHQLELSGDEVIYTNFSVRTGVRAFYNIFSVGTQPTASRMLWQFGYGVGTSFGITKNFRSDITFSMHHLNKGAFNVAASDMWKLYWGVEYKLAPKITLAAGPTLNLFVTDTYDPDYESVYSKILPTYFSDHTSQYGYNLKMWAGGKVAIRFL